MPWKVKEVMEQRIEFVVRAVQDECSVSDLCVEYGISRTTGHHWLSRYRQSGSFLSLRNQSRRPHRSPNRTDQDSEDKVLELRKKKGWGARKLKGLLQQQGIGLSERTINRILKRRGQIKAEPKNKPALQRFERSQPNQLWQMDFKGEYGLETGGYCYPLSIIDDHSRFCVQLQGLQHPSYAGVSACLGSVFRRYGVPEAMLMDHGSPWWGTANAVGLTRLGVELIEQGIQLCWSGIGHPQTQGKVERFHRTLSEALRHRRPLPQRFEQWAPALAEIRNEYNEERPHEALNMQVPRQRFCNSPRAYNPKPEPWDYSHGWQVHLIYPSGSFRWRGHDYFVSQALTGRKVGVLYVDGQLLVRYRHMYLCEVDIARRRVRSWIRPSGHPSIKRLNGKPCGK